MPRTIKEFMKKLFGYILITSWLLSSLDWQTVHQTRWVNRDRLEWMHAHERTYAVVSHVAGLILCTPCLALKPLFYTAIERVEASQEEQDSIQHAPLPDRHGFYILHDRRTSWTFVAWTDWFFYWLVPSMVWLLAVRKVFSAG